MDLTITGRQNDVQIHHRHHHVLFSKPLWNFIFIFVGLSDQRPSDYRTVGIRNHRTFGALDYMRASYGSLSKYTYFSVFTQLKDKYQPNWLEKTCFARRHISFPWFYHLYPYWSNCEFILATHRPVFFFGVTCYFSRITYFWSIVLFRCNDFIQSLYYFRTILKALIKIVNTHIIP